MNIGITVSPEFPVPPHAGYGGTQRGAFELASGLADKGHRIFLAAPADSNISHPNIEVLPVLRHSVYHNGTSPTKETLPLLQQSDASALRSFEAIADELDVVNIRWERPATMRGLGALGIRHVLSISCNLSQLRVQELLAAQSSATAAITAHTQAHWQALGAHPAIEVLPYGIDTADYRYHDLLSNEPDDQPALDIVRQLTDSGNEYVLHLASIKPHKGQATSIEIARKAGIPLVIAGTPNQIDTVTGSQYFREQIVPHIDAKNVHYFGNADEVQKIELMRHASATLFCSGFEDPTFSEPFGRVIAESLACGTPVIGYRYGSFPELVPEGIAGFGFDTVDQAVSAIANISDLDRAACASYARRELSAETFISRMEGLLLRSVEAGQVA